MENLETEVKLCYLRLWQVTSISVYYHMGGQKDRRRLITCKALVLAHDLPCVLCQPHVMEVMEFKVGERELRGYIASCIVTTQWVANHLLATSVLSYRLVVVVDLGFTTLNISGY